MYVFVNKDVSNQTKLTNKIKLLNSILGEWWLNENKYASLRAIFKRKKSLIKMKNGSNFEYFMGLGIHKDNILFFK